MAGPGKEVGSEGGVVVVVARVWDGVDVASLWPRCETPREGGAADAPDPLTLAQLAAADETPRVYVQIAARGSSLVTQLRS